MKLLPLEESCRRWLFNKNALIFSSNMEETLAGLSYEESIFFTYLVTNQDFLMKTWEEDTLLYFLQLEEKHRLHMTNGHEERRIRSR